MTKTHHDRFSELVAARGWEGRTLEKAPREYAAAFYLLSCQDSIFERALECVSRDGIDFAPLLALAPEDYDCDYYADLVRLAANLFYGRPVEGLDLSQLGHLGVDDAVTAIRIRACGVSVMLEERGEWRDR